MNGHAKFKYSAISNFNEHTERAELKRISAKVFLAESIERQKSRKTSTHTYFVVTIIDSNKSNILIDAGHLQSPQISIFNSTIISRA